MYAIVLEGRAIGQATGLVLDEELRVVDIYYSEYDPSKGYTMHWKKNTPEGGVVISRNKLGGFSISSTEGKRTHHGKGSLRNLFSKLGYRILVGSIESFGGPARVPSARLTEALIDANGLRRCGIIV